MAMIFKLLVCAFVSLVNRRMLMRICRLLRSTYDVLIFSHVGLPIFGVRLAPVDSAGL